MHVTYQDETARYDVREDETIGELKVKVAADHGLVNTCSLHLQQDGMDLSDDVTLGNSSVFDKTRSLECVPRYEESTYFKFHVNLIVIEVIFFLLWPYITHCCISIPTTPMYPNES